MEPLLPAPGHLCDHTAGVFQNSAYVVHLAKQPARPGGLEHVRLSVYRKDGDMPSDWRDAQAIKSQLVGPEAEGIHLFPAESRVTDTLNVLHLWVLPAPHYFPYGFSTERTVVDASPEDTREGKQRPLPADTADVISFDEYQRRRLATLLAASAQGYEVGHLIDELTGGTHA